MDPKNLLDYYNETSFPKTKEFLDKDLADVLYSSYPTKPNNTLQFNLNSFIFEDNHNKYGSFKKTKWKKEEEFINEKDKETIDFFDNFKGKYDKNSIENFYTKNKSTKELLQISQTYVIANEVSIQHINHNLLDHNEKKEFVLEEKIMNIDDMFDKNVNNQTLCYNKDKHTTINNKIKSPFVKSNNLLDLPVKECINLVNSTLNYPKDKPLWYIYHEGAESSYGPLSSNYINEMIDMNLLNENSKIRFIDVFVYRGTEQFEFFYIKDIKTDNFHSNIEISNITINNNK